MMDDLKDPSLLKLQLSSELGLYFMCHTCVQHVNGQLWIRLGIYDNVQKGTIPTSADSTYVVYYPHSTYIFISSLKQEHSEFILKSLASSLRCEDVIDPGHSLSSSNVQSLADLMLYPTSQGPYRAFRLDGTSDNPLDLLSSRKRKKEEKEKEEEQKRNTLPIQEDKAIYEERDKKVRAVFGIHDDPQPALNNITIQFKTDFCGQKIYIPPEEKTNEDDSEDKHTSLNETDNPSEKAVESEETGDIKIEMTVTLDGWNVLEGLKQLTKTGAASKINDKILKDMWKSNKLSIFE